jgi:hypothetical protein
MSNTKRSESGVAFVEFTLTLFVWLPLVLGTLFYGVELIRNLQAVQLARDTSSMYARGVSFRPDNANSNKDLIARLGKELNLQVTGGRGVVILTTIQYISQNECDVLPQNVACTNLLHWVVTHRTTIGDPTLRLSTYTTDPLPNLDANSGEVKSHSTLNYPYYLTDNRLQLNNKFTKLPVVQTDPSTHRPVTDLTGQPVAFGAGTPAYVVEAYFKSKQVSGFRENAGILVVDVF